MEKIKRGLVQKCSDKPSKKNSRNTNHDYRQYKCASYLFPPNNEELRDRCVPEEAVVVVEVPASVFDSALDDVTGGEETVEDELAPQGGAALRWVLVLPGVRRGA